MKNNIIPYNRKGNTLIILLVFILIAITIATTSVSVIISNAQSTWKAAQSMEAYYASEAGIENALLQLLRNPNYTGEILQVSEDSTATIVVQNNGQYTVISTGTSGTYTRIIQANLGYTNNVLSIISWREVY